MEFFTIVYLVYLFLALFLFFFFILLFVYFGNSMFHSPKYTKPFSLSIVVPCYNEGPHIRNCVEALLKSDYPGLKKIIVVDDCSKDNSYEIIKQLAKEYPQVMAVQTPKNTGNASGSKNYGSQFVTTELIGFTDADSYPKPDAISKMIGYFDAPKTAAVTSQILVQNRKNLLEKLQAIEYKIIAFTRKLLDPLDSIYVTPGPLAIYRKSVYDSLKGFDDNNMTEDIEITWHFLSQKYKVAMAFDAKVYTTAPSTFKEWFVQRNRWNIGGIQTVLKYRRDFLKNGMLGFFVIPFFVTSAVIGLIGTAILIYRFMQTVIVSTLNTSYSIAHQATVIRLQDLALAPNVLFFFGIMLFFLGFLLTLLALYATHEKDFPRHSIFLLLFYSIFYLMIYPFLFIVSISKFLKGSYSW